jgi:hypothetical protein
VADWVTISALATAAGTFALAGATYASVRSGNRAARAAERSLLAELQPLLVESSEQDPVLHVNFVDVSGIEVPGGGAAVDVRDNRLYIVLSLRNVGRGIGVLHGGRVFPWRRGDALEPGSLDAFRLLTRDIYIPSGKVGFWQIAYREEHDAERRELLRAVETGQLSAEVLYGDVEGGQRVISRFRVLRQDGGTWAVSAVRHWQVDRGEPR